MTELQRKFYGFFVSAGWRCKPEDGGDDGDVYAKIFDHKKAGEYKIECRALVSATREQAVESGGYGIRWLETSMTDEHKLLWTCTVCYEDATAAKEVMEAAEFELIMAGIPFLKESEIHGRNQAELIALTAQNLQLKKEWRLDELAKEIGGE